MSFLGSSVMRSAVCAVAVVVLAGLPSSSVAQTGAFTDSRDGKTYKTVKIGKQTWMARNLDYAPDSGKPWSFTAQNLEDVPDSGKSWCYNDSASYCKKYGRLYTWETARAVCPSGYHLPSRGEWDELGKAVGSNLKHGEHWDTRNSNYWISAGKKLKAKSGWNKNNGKSGNGTDDFGFSALPGGGFQYREFSNVGKEGGWWMSDMEDDAIVKRLYNDSDILSENYSEDPVNYNAGYSVRCVRDVKK